MSRSVGSSGAPTPSGVGRRGEPTWDIALLYPEQGSWSEHEYLALNASRLVEFSDGCLEVLPMPTLLHQLIVDFVHELLKRFVSEHAKGKVLFAPLPVRLWPGKYREPDIIYLSPGRLKDLHGQPDGADLVMEMVSEGEENRRRDLEIKPYEYAKAGIAEYWIVDAEGGQITVLALQGESYRSHGVFRAGDTADSLLLPGFRVAVADVLAIAQQVDR